MNVVVTIPKKRLADIEREEADIKRRLAAGEKGVSYFWAMSRKPKELQAGDRMYFVWGGALRAYHIVTGFREVLQCETTGQKYKGCCVLLDPVIHEVEALAMEGFRGFRYFSGFLSRYKCADG